jgi:hypothetical protein
MPIPEIVDLNDVMDTPTDITTDTDVTTDDTDLDSADDTFESDVDDAVDDEVSSDEPIEPAVKPGKAEKITPEKIDAKSGIPAKYKKLFKEDKELRSIYFQNKEYAKIFETPQKAAAIAEKLELYGGIDGVEKDLGEMATIDQMFASGDPAVLDTWTKMSPQGFNKIMPSAIERYSHADPEGWTHMASRVIAQSFDSVGLVQKIQQVYKSLDPKSEAAQILSEFYNGYLDNIYANVKNGPQQKKIDPERQKLQADRQAFDNQRQNTFLSDLATEANKIWADRQTKELNSYIRGRNLGPDQLEILNSNIDARFKRILEKDTVAQKQMTELLRAGNKDAYIKYMNGKLEKYMPQATKEVWRAFTGLKGSTTKDREIEKKTVGKTKSGVIQISGIPSPGQVDRAATIKYAKTLRKSYDALIMDNTCVLTNGKIVQWQ